MTSEEGDNHAQIFGRIDRYQRVGDELSFGMLAWSSELAAYTCDEGRASQLMKNLSGAVKAECEALVNGAGMPMPAM